MKLGEALALRADVQKRMHRMQALLVENATVQEGDTPPVQPVELLEELGRLHEEHERLNEVHGLGRAGQRRQQCRPRPRTRVLRTGA